MERRIATEFRATGRKLEGLAVPYGVETRIADFSEIVLPGSFSTTLADGHDILALVDHDNGKVLARTKAGTLRLSETTRGLEFSLDVPHTSYGNDILALVESRNAGGMSFGFSVPSGGERWVEDRRELRSVTLHEISVVASHPAYDKTVVHARKRPVVALGVSHVRRYLETL